jgi:hypothetical protein
MNSSFRKEDFRMWTIEEMQYVLFSPDGRVVGRGNLSDCRAAISCDLAWEEGQSNDDTVIMPGFLTPQSDLLIDSYIQKKGMRPDEVDEALFSMEARLKAITHSVVYIGFEKAKHEKIQQWFLKRSMRSKNRYLNIKPLVWDTDKIERIITRLEPRYRQHVVYHRQGMGDLESQLIRLRSSTHDDLADAAQGLVQLLEFPKNGEVKKEEPNSFDFWRKLAIDHKKSLDPLRKKDHKYIFGMKGKKKTGISAIRGI